MDNPGIKLLADIPITQASGQQVTDWFDGLDGIAEVDALFDFKFTAAGSKFVAWLQTSLDQGQSAIDLWCFTATNAAKVQARRLKPDGNLLTPADGALADDTVAAGIVLGDRFRLKYAITGNYVGGLFKARLAAR